MAINPFLTYISSVDILHFMFTDANFDFLESWEHHGNPTRWLRAHQDTLRATAASAGWDHVAEALESKGWSYFWKSDRRLTGVALARAMALIAFRARRAGPRRDRQTNLRSTVAEAVKDAIVELAAAGTLPIPAASATPPPPPARGVSAADMAARPRRAFLPDRPATRVFLTDADATEAATAPTTANLKKDQAHE
jgi:hypothetical protein